MSKLSRRALVVVGVVLPLLLPLGCGQKQPVQTGLQPGGPGSAGAGGRPAPAAQPAAEPTMAEVGKAAPDFSLTTLDGKKLDLAGLKGKPVVVNFWASWCGYCAAEAPDLEALYKQYSPKGLQMLGVGTDEPEKLGPKAKELGLTYPIGSNPDAARSYGVQGIPHTFIINSKGEVTASLVGQRSKEELEAEIKKAM